MLLENPCQVLRMMRYLSGGLLERLQRVKKNASRKPLAALKLKNIASATCQTARDFGMPLKFEYISQFCDLCDTGQRNCLSQLLLYLE